MMIGVSAQIVGGRNDMYGGAQWSRLREGDNGQIARFQTRVFSTEAGWTRFWFELTGQDPRTAPRLDWNTEQVVIVVGGLQAAGTKMAIEDVKILNAAKAEVQYSVSLPPRQGRETDKNRKPQTIPYAAVRIKRLPVDYVFTEVPARPTGIVIGRLPGYGYDDRHEGRYPVRWSLVKSGETSLITTRLITGISDSYEFLRYWNAALGTREGEDVARSVDWANEVVFVIHLGMTKRNSSVGIASVYVDDLNRVTVEYYERASVGVPSRGSAYSHPYLIARIPRYSSSPIFRQVSPPR